MYIELYDLMTKHYQNLADTHDRLIKQLMSMASSPTALESEKKRLIDVEKQEAARCRDKAGEFLKLRDG